MQGKPTPTRITAIARPLLALAVLLLGALALAQVEATFVRDGDTLSGPATLAAGYTTVTFVNDADQPYELTLIRLHDGVTEEEIEPVMAAAQEGTPDSIRAVLEVVDLYGGTGTAFPGAGASAGITLAEGDYIAISENFEGGVEARFSFEVRGSNGAEAPAADRVVTLFDFGFGIDAEIPAGEQLWRLSNIGRQPHHLMVFPIEPGTTLDDVQAALSEPDEPGFVIGPPAVMSATFSGGLGIDVTVDMTPGSYAAICFFPDLETGMPHAALGMVALFEVTGE